VSRASRIVGALALLTLLVWHAPRAEAHAVLQSSEPARGATLAQPPKQIVLHFSEPVEVSFGSVQVFDSAGDRVDAGRPGHLAGDSSSVRLPVPRLSRDAYVVTWRVISADSHPVHGAFTFRVGAGAGGDTQQLSRELLTSGQGSRTVGVLFGIVRGLAYLAVALVLGGAFFVVVLWPDDLDDRRALRLVWAGWALALATAILGVGLQGIYGSGYGLGEILHPSVWRNVLDTRFGRVWMGRALVLLAAAPLLRLLLRGRRRDPMVTGAGILIGCGLAAGFGLAGHAGTGTQVPAAVVSDLAHVAAMSVWLGGLAVLVVAVLTSAEAVAHSRVVVRFSAIAFACVAVLVATGAYQSWRAVGSFTALRHTTYGTLLITKLALFVALVGLAALSRRLVHGHWALRLRVPPGPGAATASPRLADLRRSVAAEVLVALAVIGVTATLVNAQPARSALALPYSTELTNPKVIVDITVDRQRPDRPTSTSTRSPLKAPSRTSWT
jgi:copper transport protein